MGRPFSIFQQKEEINQLLEFFFGAIFLGDSE